jgi:Tol biopolymer transport system component
MRLLKYMLIGLGFIFVLGLVSLWLHKRSRPSIDARIFYTSKRDGYYGLYVRDGNVDEKLFDSRDILEAYPNLARYHISYGVSIDGRYVAYSAINVLGDADIFLLDRETGESGNLTSDTHTDTYPVFSHDGEWIAYLSHEKSGRRYDEIILIRRDGTQRLRLTNMLLRISSIAFSPDDRSVLFVKHLGENSSIASLNLETGEIKELNRPVCLNISPRFNSSGNRIVYISDCHDSLDVWIMNSDGSNRKPLYQGPGDAYEPHFLQNGGPVIFISVSEEMGNGGASCFSLLSVNLDGRNVRNLIPEKYRGRQIYMSQLDVPGSENIVYFQGKFMDRKRKAHHTIFSLDIKKHILRRVVSEGLDSMNPIMRPDTKDLVGQLPM